MSFNRTDTSRKPLFWELPRISSKGAQHFITACSGCVYSIAVFALNGRISDCANVLIIIIIIIIIIINTLADAGTKKSSMKCTNHTFG
jgi:hypothetical protein